MKLGMVKLTKTKGKFPKMCKRNEIKIMTWNKASAQQLRESYYCFWRILWWTNSPEIILSLKIVQELVYFLFFEAEKMNARRLSRTFIKIVWLKSEEIGLVAEPVRLKSERGLKNTPKE